MTDRVRLAWFGAFAGFCVVVAFGVGVIATAAYSTNGREVTGTSEAENDVVRVELGDLFIEPAALEASAGEVTFEVTNGGKTDHNFSIQGVDSTPMLGAGESASLTVDLEPGTYTVICEVAGHEQGGMKATLTVGQGTQGSSQGAMGAVDHGGMGHMSAAQMAKVDAAVTERFPAETKGLGGRPLQPELVDGFKVFELTADETSWEVEPGKVVDAMAYNGILPGPQIDVDLGDRVRVVLHNELKQPTTLHFHGVRVPNSMDGVPVVTQDAVMPGDSFTYEFNARNSGTHMYHPHFNATQQITEGLLGAFVVHDPGDPRVAVDQTMVLNDGPLGFTINGKGFPATAPIALERGETLRIRYMNEGLQIHPMHLHGLVQKVIAKDGYRLRPYRVDTLMVAPGERYDVLVKADAPGVWAFHCHILSHVEGPEGMFGMVTAVIVE